MLTWSDVNEVALSLRAQRVTVEPGVAGARPAVIIVAEVGALGRIEMDAALAYNLTTEHGALVIRRGAYALRRVLPLATLTASELARAIVASGREAERLVPPVAPVAAYRAVFAQFAE